MKTTPVITGVAISLPSGEYLAPSILGGGAQGMFNLPELADLAQKRLVQFTDVQTIGSDLRILARVVN